MGYNVFADLGFENPERELLTCHLVRALRATIVEKGLTPDAVSVLWNVPASEVSLLLRGDWEDYSVEQLYQFHDALKLNVNVRRLSVNHAPPADAEAETGNVPTLALSA